MVLPRRVLLIVGTFCLSVLMYVDRVCISAAEGPIARDLGLSKREMGWVLSAFALGYALCQVPGGLLADRFGPRRILTTIVIFWSLFTGLTAAAFNLVSMIVVRLLFGAGEAGAFPGIARATFSWIPMQERGLVQGINFSGSRLGAAVALPVVALMVESLGWRASFIVLMLVGFGWSVFWYFWFRDDPAQHPSISSEELEFILAHRQQRTAAAAPARGLAASTVLSSANIWLVSLQYFCSNFTFFFCLTWLFPHLKTTYQLSGIEAGLYSAAPLIGGALGNWYSGWLVDRIYRSGRWTLSRRIPAIAGFVLTAVGLVGSLDASTALSSIVWFSIAIFGADMTLSPSWSVCIDVGKRHAGVISGTMNMAGNVGSFITALAFPYFKDWTGSNDLFFFVAAILNGVAVVAWLFINPQETLESAA